MKEKKPHSPIEESSDSMMVQEPIASATAFADTIEEDAPLDIPGLPQTWDELMDCVKEGEEEFERGEAISYLCPVKLKSWNLTAPPCALKNSNN